MAVGTTRRNDLYERVRTHQASPRPRVTYRALWQRHCGVAIALLLRRIAFLLRYCVVVALLRCIAALLRRFCGAFAAFLRRISANIGDRRPLYCNLFAEQIAVFLHFDLIAAQLRQVSGIDDLDIAIIAPSLLLRRRNPACYESGGVVAP
jgi:hypothetical protein